MSRINHRSLGVEEKQKSRWMDCGGQDRFCHQNVQEELWVSQDGENIWGRGTGTAGIRAPLKKTECRASAMTSSYSFNYF